MTSYDFHRITTRRRSGGDALRALLLILGTVLVGLAISASVPDGVGEELAAQRASGLPVWHGNVAAHGPRD